LLGGVTPAEHDCRRFAELGYQAVAPELFFRQGDVSKFTDFKDIISKVVFKVPDAQALRPLRG
jgi:carboxymethylenebutenolidase